MRDLYTEEYEAMVAFVNQDEGETEQPPPLRNGEPPDLAFDRKPPKLRGIDGP